MNVTISIASWAFQFSRDTGEETFITSWTIFHNT